MILFSKQVDLMILFSKYGFLDRADVVRYELDGISQVNPFNLRMF